LRVGLRIRCAGRARANERCVCCEASEGHIHLANAEGATAAAMQHGYQRGELFEGCKSTDWKGTRWPTSSDVGRTGRKFSESCPVLGRNKPRTFSELKPSGWRETTRMEQAGGWYHTHKAEEWNPRWEKWAAKRVGSRAITRRRIPRQADVAIHPGWPWSP